jgi:hypothetical protein
VCFYTDDSFALFFLFFAYPFVARFPPSITLLHETAGYAGPSCEYRLCPKGDDPMTKHTGYRTITITTKSETRLSTLTGDFVFQFNGQTFLFPPTAASFDSGACKSAFETLRNVEQVNCTVDVLSAYSTVYTVQFMKFPAVPHENNVFTNNGNPELADFSCETSFIGKVRSDFFLDCSIGELNTDKVYPGILPFLLCFAVLFQTIEVVLIFFVC